MTHHIHHIHQFLQRSDLDNQKLAASTGYPIPDVEWKGRFWPKRGCDAKISIILRLYKEENKIDIPICRTVEMADELNYQLRGNEVIFPRRL